MSSRIPLESPARSGPPRSVLWLSALVAFLALVASAIGLFWQPGASPVSFTTVHGQTVQLFGSGIYRDDTLFTGAANRGTDAATLFLGVPLLLVALVLARRTLAAHLSARAPRLGPAVFLLASGVITPALVLVLRRAPIGYLLSFALLGIIVVLGPAIAAQTVSQLSAGISFTLAEVVGPIAGFGALALLAIWVLTALLRGLEPEGAVELRPGPGPIAHPLQQRSRFGA